MNNAKNDIVASIARANLELDAALEDVKSLPLVDPMTFGFVTHALNNYLQVTLGTVGLLTKELKDDPRPNVGTWLKGLQEVTQRMRHLLAELRSGPRKPAPQMVFEKMDLGVLVRRACDFYRRIAARRQVALVLEMPKVAVFKVRTDRLAVAAILDNLFSNAVKFSPPDGRVTVQVKMDGDKVVCAVRDEGPGVDPKDRVNLFRQPIKSRVNGKGDDATAGYGLIVAAELTANLGGDIGCESEPGRGACFFIRLPSAQRVSRVKLPQ